MNATRFAFDLVGCEEDIHPDRVTPQFRTDAIRTSFVNELHAFGIDVSGYLFSNHCLSKLLHRLAARLARTYGSPNTARTYCSITSILLRPSSVSWQTWSPWWWTLVCVKGLILHLRQAKALHLLIVVKCSTGQSQQMNGSQVTVIGASKATFVVNKPVFTQLNLPVFCQSS